MNEYPRGKVDDEDQGATEIGVGEWENCVRIQFKVPMLWVALEPDLAEAFAQTILGYAKSIRAKSN